MHLALHRSSATPVGHRSTPGATLATVKLCSATPSTHQQQQRRPRLADVRALSPDLDAWVASYDVTLPALLGALEALGATSCDDLQFLSKDNLAGLLGEPGAGSMQQRRLRAAIKGHMDCMRWQHLTGGVGMYGLEAACLQPPAAEVEIASGASGMITAAAATVSKVAAIATETASEEPANAGHGDSTATAAAAPLAATTVATAVAVSPVAPVMSAAPVKSAASAVSPRPGRLNAPVLVVPDASTKFSASASLLRRVTDHPHTVDPEHVYRLEFVAGARNHHIKGGGGPAAAAATLRTADGVLVSQVQKPLGAATNNMAGYLACIYGVEAARRLGVRKLVVVGDSNLVVQQVKGWFACKHPRLVPLHMTALGLLRQFESWSIHHKNSHQMDALAKALCNEAMYMN